MPSGPPPPPVGNGQRRSKTIALVVRDWDPRRIGIAGHLDSISTSEVGLLVPTVLEIGDYISIDLEHPIQRIKVKVRACVRQVQEFQAGWYQVACSLFSRINPRDVLGLR